MSETAAPRRVAFPLAGAAFAAAVVWGAALVFLAEPMVGQMLLPRLGGAPAVWNASLAFFQIALLIGYAYAHLVQRIHAPRRQMVLHLGVLLAAALALPLQLRDPGGQDAASHPVQWLLASLALSIGAPFAALSATAPLLQAWSARTSRREGAGPYGLYAASNLGSLVALVAYPFLIQPLVGLKAQALGWSLGYAVFALLICAVVLAGGRAASDPPPSSGGGGSARRAETEGTPRWRERAAWTLLAALPSSLLLGVTAHITADVASAPFLWVLPLALYLLSFVLAFHEPAPIPPKLVLILQAVAAPICLQLIPIRTRLWLPLLGVHLATFALTALMCHQALVRRRPPPERLTEFYLCIAVGGAVGGAFNAFLAPVVFDNVWEYPLALVLAGLARPGALKPPDWLTWTLVFVAVACALILAGPYETPTLQTIVLFALGAAAAFLLRSRRVALTVVLAILALGAQAGEQRYRVVETRRSFFGVAQIGQLSSRARGPIRFLVHGSTLHGAEALDAAWRCVPMTYYDSEEPIGQVFRAVQARSPSISFGVVGMGAATTAAWVRAADRMRYFEIDPLIVRIAGSRFDYWHGCAKGPVGVTLGDARLSLERWPGDAFDVLLVDAFSSDSVPTHLLTVEAMRVYLRVVRPGGVVILHLSNRNLDLTGPAAAAVKEAGGAALIQTYIPPPGQPVMAEAGSIVLLAARTPEVLAPFRRDLRWQAPLPKPARPWTDDYSNVLGALIAHMWQGH